MALVTQRRTGGPVAVKQKSFAWSFSKLKNYEVCPKRYYETDVLKNYNDGDNNEDLQWGTRVHDVMAKRCQLGTPIPDGYPEWYELWAQRILSGGGEVFTELESAIDANFGVAPWFGARDGSGPQPWFRAKIDLVKKMGNIALLVDWKTGKIPQREDSFQLALSAACAFARWPDLLAIRCSFVWLKEDAESSENFLREDMANMWRNLWPRVLKLQQAHSEMSFPPQSGRMCAKWCKVVSCPNHGKTF